MYAFAEMGKYGGFHEASDDLLHRSLSRKKGEEKYLSANDDTRDLLHENTLWQHGQVPHLPRLAPPLVSLCQGTHIFLSSYICLLLLFPPHLIHTNRSTHV